MSTSTSVAPATGTGGPAGYRVAFTRILRILAMIMAALSAIQIALAAYGVFGQMKGDSNAFAGHQTLGMALAVVALLVLVAALVARPNTRAVVCSVVLLVLVVAQPFLAEAGKSSSVAIGALHGLSGAAVLALAGVLPAMAVVRRDGAGRE